MHPRMGGRKLLHFLDAILAAEDIPIGRDRFFNLLRRNDLLVPKLRRQRRTTYVDKSLPLRPNLIKDLVVTRANQVWVSDITYIPVGDFFVYLSLITDLRRGLSGYTGVGATALFFLWAGLLGSKVMLSD